jgi:hypothetical protein
VVLLLLQRALQLAVFGKQPPACICTSVCWPCPCCSLLLLHDTLLLLLLLYKQ